MNVITMTRVHDPLNRADQEKTTYEFQPGVETVADLMLTVAPPGDGLVSFVVSVNGHELRPIEWADIRLVNGLDLIIMPVFHGGGGDDKNPLRTILMIVVTVVAYVYGGPLGSAVFGSTFGASVTAALGSAIIMTAGSMLINAIAPLGSPQTPALNGAGSIDQSNAYSWNPQTTQQQGVAMPVAYGTCKLTGNVIGAYREAVGANQYINVLISLGEGPYENINSIKINGQPLENYRGITVNSRLGVLDQTVIPGFGDTRVEYAMATKVVAGSPVTYTTIGSNFDGLEVELTFPNGLYYYDDNGNLAANSVSYRIEIRPVGGAWETITTQPGSYQVTHFAGQWTCGYWDSADVGVRQWNVTVFGSTTFSDHYEGQPYETEWMWTWRWISADWEEIVLTTLDYVTATAAQQQIIRTVHKKLNIATGQYEIRVTNLSTDQTSSRYGDDLYLSAVKEIISDDFTYPGEVLVGLRALATDQISGGFSFECRTTGKLCRVYRDGAWRVETTNNPAWVCWDILTQPVFDTTFIAAGTCTVNRKSATKTSGATAWDSAVKSEESTSGAACCSCMPAQTNKRIMFGLNADPDLNNSFNSLDYAWYYTNTGALAIWESGVNIVGSWGTYTTATILAIRYNGSTIDYLADGVVVRSVATTAGRAFSFDSSFYDVGGSINNMTFGPGPVLQNTCVSEYRAHDPSKLDLTRWIEWASHCNDLVPDGNGGTEARLTWDGLFDSAKTMWDQALTVAMMGRATPYWRGNTITIAIDKAETPGFLISVGNIGQDSFDEVYLSMDGRAGSVEADYLNLDNDLNRDKMTVVNYDAPDEWGSASAALQGEIRPSGIYRHCKFKLARTEALKRLVTVEMSTDSIAFTLGDVGNVQHDVPRWGEGGRIVAATANSITIDKSVTIEAATSYAISVRYQDNTIEERVLTNAAGAHTVLTFTSALSPVPEVYDIWAFGEVGTYVKPMRVVGIEPKSDLKRTIVLEDYNASLYTLDGNLPLLATINYTPNPAPESVTNLTLSERLVVNNGVVSTILIASWDIIPYSSPTQKVGVFAGRVGQSLIGRGTLFSTQNSIEIPVVDGETWRVVVSASNGVVSEAIAVSPSATRTIVGKLAPPEDVVNLRSSPTSFGGLILSWDSVSDLDVKYGGYYAIRYSSALSGATWENSLELTTVTATSVTIPAALDGSYLVKAVDTGGRESINAVMLVTDIPSLIAFNFIDTATDGVGWGGTHSGTYTVADKLYLDMAGEWDAITDFDAMVGLDGYGGALLSGYYELADSVDLGSVQTARCGLAIDFSGIDSASLWDDITDFDAVATFSGLVPGVGVQPQISLSDDNITYTDWTPYINGDYTFRYAKFRLKLYTDNPQNYPEVTQFVATVDMPDRSERGMGVSVLAGGTAITFATEFMVAPIVRGSITNAQSGDTVNITSITTTGATLQVLNGGVGAARTMDWQAVSY